MSNLIAALTQAVSQDGSQVHQGQRTLAALELSMPGYHRDLVRIYSDVANVPLEVRFMALICAKNGVDRFWRSTATNAISEEDKSAIRQALLSTQTLSEEVNQLATQVAVILSKIARLDFPARWPELVPSLIGALSSTEELLVRRRLLQILHHVTKALSSKRLPGDRRAFRSLCDSMMPHVWQLLTTHVGLMQQIVASGDLDAAYPCCELSILCVKIARLVVVHGLADIGATTESMSFAAELPEVCTSLLSTLRSVDNSSVFGEALARLCARLVKGAVEMQARHPLSMQPVLDRYLSFTLGLVCADDAQRLPRKVLIFALTFVKNVVTCNEYMPLHFESLAGTPEMRELSLGGHQVVRQYFIDGAGASRLVHTLVTRFFVVDDSALADWAGDPEAYANDEDVVEAWRFRVRPCAEALFMALMSQYREQLAPVVMEMLSGVQSADAALAAAGGPAQATPDALLSHYRAKEAVYNAIGTGAYDLYDALDFASWFESTLCPELRILDASFALVRRRIVVVLAFWVGVKLPVEQRPVLYEVLLVVLEHDPDLVVRIEAAKALRCAIDDMDFRAFEFQPFLTRSVQALYNLVVSVCDGDTKLPVLSVLSLVVERMGTAIREHVGAFAEALPRLWDEFEDSDLLRCSLVTLLTNITNSCGPPALGMIDFMLAIVRYGVDLQGNAHVYLMEDALALWLAVVRNTDEFDARLIELYGAMQPIFELDVAQLEVAVQITRVYVRSGSVDFMRTYCAGIVQCFHGMLVGVNERAHRMLLRVIETIVIVYEGAGFTAVASLVEQAIGQVLQPHDHMTMLAACFNLISRCVLHAPQEMFALIVSLEAQSGAKVVEALIQSWIANFNCIGQASERKLNGLAMLKTVSALAGAHAGSAQTSVAAVGLVGNVSREPSVARVTLGDEEDAYDAYDADEEFPGEHETHDARRERLLVMRDPVYNLDLDELVNA